MINFEKNVKVMLKEKGISQAEFARRLGVGKSTVSNWLCSHREPSLSYIRKILKVLNCTFDELVE